MNLSTSPVPYYHKKEEFLNVLTHAVGALLSTLGVTWLVYKAILLDDGWVIFSFFLYGTSLILLYLASTTYHMSHKKRMRRILNKLDHGAIYLLIAGSYTPFCLIAMREGIGWYLFGVVWILALAGFVFKLFFAGRFDRLSTALYVMMGWLVVLTFNSLIDSVSSFTLYFLIAGGISYSVGALFYLLRKLPYQHAIFHGWVMLGSILHFASIVGLL